MYRSLGGPYYPVWASASIKNLQGLQKLHNQAVRLVMDSPYDAHSEPLIKELGWLTIKQLMDTEAIKIVYKALHNEAPKHLKAVLKAA